MTHTVSTEKFEGPLGLLLELVERNQLEVTAISVAEITGQYLERIQQMEDRSPEHLSEFLGLGARLLYIKSLALLPHATPDEQTEELRQLSLELEEYRRFQAAARELGRRGRAQTWERPVVEQLAAGDVPLPRLALPQLAAAFAAALARHQPAAPAVVRRHLSLETVREQLRRRLAGGFQLQAALRDCRDRLEVVVTFLALLELIREGAARVEQASTLAPITVEAARG